jgi:hypothetical protein
MLIGSIGCKDDKSNPSDSNSNTPVAPSFPQITFNGPNTTSTDPNAQLAISYATSLNAGLTQSTIFAALPAQQNGNTYTWTYAAAGATYTLTAVKQNNGSFTWTVVLNGTAGATTYNNFKVCEGTSSADGKSGTWIFYELGVAGKTGEFVYSTSASNVLTGTMNSYNTSGTLTSKTVMINNPDGSGSMESYDDGVHRNYRSDWIANGSGTWYTYNDSGVQTGTGTWT